LSAALQRANYPFLLATRMTAKDLKKQGVVGDHIRTGFYSNRMDYLNTLQQQDILILALDWPDESPKHIDELATIFPTKTPEYLASGRPILVHCPENYFLARFFRKHNCGLVVPERSVDALEAAVRYLAEDSSQVENMRKSALTAAQFFNADQLASRFQTTVHKAARHCQTSRSKV
jgi:glycosyltransferase involved in cell wall biosynthesis